MTRWPATTSREGGATPAAGGYELHADICIVMHVADGLIVEIYEYLDRDAIAVVFPAG